MTDTQHCTGDIRPKQESEFYLSRDILDKCSGPKMHGFSNLNLRFSCSSLSLMLLVSYIVFLEYLAGWTCHVEDWFCFLVFLFLNVEFDRNSAILQFCFPSAVKKDIILCTHGGVGSFSIPSAWTESC